MSTHRDDRLRADHLLLQALDEASTILALEGTGDPPDRYTLTFRGKGLGRDPASQSEVTILELHQIDLRLPYAYPASPPDIRWMTPILHPNVSFSGFVNLADIGLAWSRELPLDLVCERLWDVARGEFVNLGKAANYSAKNWFEKNREQPLPVDSRPLRDRSAQTASNVIRYERRGAGSIELVGATAASEVLFIDESTPTPPIPTRQPIPRPRGGDDVLYIGPE
ncbi:MAG: ubiquitin-conjugating enzyme E2 [Pirellulaceae bacterium]|nr:ubiquitin-conjugating enzyme E2 [Pirellulaceae bacterium]